MRSKFTAKGFTLVELVVGIVVLAVAMMIMNTMLISQSKDALEPLYRLRASQLGQSIMQNMLSRSYDENSDHNGGLYRCGEGWPIEVVDSACSTTLGRDGSETLKKHQDFNDVDDFITYLGDNGRIAVFIPAVAYGDVLGNLLPDQYTNYSVKIEVVKISTDVGVVDDRAKKLVVIIKTPSNEEIRFSALKGNY
ncbi:MSHA biogenesis protein MshD [Psychromonas marina]|uniref:MSHA biogenesis protein MshD n=1 Tax=Psychromonas marina TaxID=88364 RepID=A0ABQ6E487_9GAMM|nr:prepilin-type N-terminal cleavage/methylation domain-containing protein [Psychromonas marina]GLS92239.1 MSHA biogenesis protein MshD [Psychromonas marina]